jgi:hypothetical protein
VHFAALLTPKKNFGFRPPTQGTGRDVLDVNNLQRLASGIASRAGLFQGCNAKLIIRYSTPSPWRVTVK